MRMSCRASVAMMLLAMPTALSARPKPADIGGGHVPALEEVLVAAGWTMTPERSATYTVGDIYNRSTNTPVAFKADCFSAEAREAAYTSLEVIQAMKAGARVPLGVARFKAEGMQYKQLKFAEPYMSELADMHLVPNDACRQFLAGRPDLADLFVIKAVLSAEVKEQLCRSLEVGAGALGLGASGSMQQECVQGSEGHVAVAYKTQPAAQTLIGSASVPPPRAPAIPGTPAAATANVDFGSNAAGLGVQARLNEQRCDEDAKTAGAEARAARLDAAADQVRTKATQAWAGQSSDLELCVDLPRAQRGDCIQAANSWLDLARSMEVELPEAVETVDTDCGARQLAFAAETRRVAANEVAQVEALLRRLEASDPPAARVTPRRAVASGRVALDREDPETMGRWHNEQGNYGFSQSEGTISFDNTASLHAIKGEAKRFSGHLDTATLTGGLTVEATSLTTGLSVRDSKMHEFCLQSGSIPTITFEVTSISGDSAGLQSGTGKGTVTLNGKLFIRSRSKSVAIRTSYSFSGGKLHLKGKHPMKWADYGVPDPSIVISTLLPDMSVQFAMALQAR
jgi:hypothetical protein